MQRQLVLTRADVLRRRALVVHGERRDAGAVAEQLACETDITNSASSELQVECLMRTAKPSSLPREDAESLCADATRDGALAAPGRSSCAALRALRLALVLRLRFSVIVSAWRLVCTAPNRLRQRWE